MPRPLRAPPSRTLCCALLSAAACTGSVGPEIGVPFSSAEDGSAVASSLGDQGAGASLAGFQPPPGSLRRLTRSQFRHAVREVFGNEVSASDLDPDSFTESFATIGAATVVTSDRGVEQYNPAVERGGHAVLGRDQAFCLPRVRADRRSDDPCVRGLMQRFGLRAWRRPLEDAELARFVTLAANVSTTLGDGNEGARSATAALFMSPSFLYRPELGAPSHPLTVAALQLISARRSAQPLAPW